MSYTEFDFEKQFRITVIDSTIEEIQAIIDTAQTDKQKEAVQDGLEAAQQIGILFFSEDPIKAFKKMIDHLRERRNYHEQFNEVYRLVVNKFLTTETITKQDFDTLYERIQAEFGLSFETDDSK